MTPFIVSEEHKERFKFPDMHSLYGGNSMPYRHEGWTLYTRNVKLKGGRNQTIYFFSKRAPKSGTPCELPSGYSVGVNRRTGLPFLRKK